VLVDYAVGSILSGGSGYPDTNSPREWAKMTNMIQKYTEQTRLKIPVIYGVDAVHGHNNVKGAVIFPYDINVAAGGNPELADKSGELTAEALRATGIHWNFAPVLDIARNPKWGRTYETFGEDPYLASVMGASMIRGMQRSGKVAACAKHYVGYGAAENGFDRQPADISERTFREVLFPSFKAAIDAGVRTIMVNSGEVNGVPAHASKWLLNDVLRKEFGFQGLVVSDWQDLQKIQTYHKAAPDLKTAIVRAYNAGIDMSMIPMNVEEIELLKEAVQEGLIPMERIDEAVRRVLSVKYELGLFENRYVDENQANAVFARDDQQETARMLARQSITLLKNSSNVLPLSQQIKNILVTGAAAHSKSYLCGGWTIDWQGAQEEDLITGQTILEGIKTKVSAETMINYLDPSASREKLLQAAKDADVCLAVIGEKPYAETPGDIEDISLSKEQRTILQTLQESGKPVVLVVVSGRPLIIDWEAQNLPVILYAYLPGTEGGNAVADVLFGDYNPAGRLPFTIPKRATQVPMRYNDRLTAAYDPLYPFGYGLSYTQFRYINLQAPESIKQEEPLRVTVDVKNTGKIAGDHIVQVYYTNVYASVTPRRAQLCGFQRVSLPLNETKTVTFDISPEQLKLYNEDMQFVEEARAITLQIGRLTQTVEIMVSVRVP
jgi:beta-glucosidase